jgi:hypothetical protein
MLAQAAFAFVFIVTPAVIVTLSPATGTCAGIQDAVEFQNEPAPEEVILVAKTVCVKPANKKEKSNAALLKGNVKMPMCKL